MPYLIPILALLTSASGWFYLFHSRAASNLAGVEDDRLNRRRVLLRRCGGFCMLLLGGGLYVGFEAADPTTGPRVFVGVWLANMVLIAGLVILALLDVRLTHQLRRRARSLQDVEPASTHEGTPLDRD